MRVFSTSKGQPTTYEGGAMAVRGGRLWLRDDLCALWWWTPDPARFAEMAAEMQRTAVVSPPMSEATNRDPAVSSS